MKAEILTSGMDHRLEQHYESFCETFGIGPCGAYAALRRAQGWGQVALTEATTADGITFPHYIIIQDGGIVDLTAPEELEYSGIEILDADEMPEATGQREMDWLAERI